MGVLLYYSISADLSENEIIEIDRQAYKRRKSAYLFVRKFPSNSKRKVKRLCLFIVFMFNISQPLAPCTAAVILPPAIHSISTIKKSRTRTYRNYRQIVPIINPIIKSKMDKIVLTDQKIEDLNCYKLEKSSITLDKTILELRGGGFYDWLTLAFIIFMHSLKKSDSFENVPLPNQDPFGWLNNKYNRKPMEHRSHKSSRFELKMAAVNNNMCSGLKMPDKNGFVMSYQEAYDLVAETYPGYLEVNDSCKITDWQAAKHIYHANGLGINPEDYGFTQEQLERIRGESQYKGGGLIAYARRGYKLPQIEMIQDYQFKLKTSCKNALIKRKSVPYYDVNGISKAQVFASPSSEDSSSIIVAFSELTGDLITGDKQRKVTFDRFKNENYLGGKKWMLKWNNNIK